LPTEHKRDRNISHGKTDLAELQEKSVSPQERSTPQETGKEKGGGWEGAASGGKGKNEEIKLTRERVNRRRRRNSTALGDQKPKRVAK